MVNIEILFVKSIVWVALELGDALQEDSGFGSQVRSRGSCLDNLVSALLKQGALLGKLIDLGGGDGAEGLGESIGRSHIGGVERVK
jgi:hypothetical protein